MTHLAALPRPLPSVTSLRRPAATAQARPRLLARPPPLAAAARRPRLPRAAPDDPRQFGEPAPEEEEESSDDEEFDTIAGAVEVVDEDEAEVGACALYAAGGIPCPASVGHDPGSGHS